MKPMMTLFSTLNSELESTIHRVYPSVKVTNIFFVLPANCCMKLYVHYTGSAAVSGSVLGEREGEWTLVCKANREANKEVLCFRFGSRSRGLPPRVLVRHSPQSNPQARPLSRAAKGRHNLLERYVQNLELYFTKFRSVPRKPLLGPSPC